MPLHTVHSGGRGSRRARVDARAFALAGVLALACGGRAIDGFGAALGAGGSAGAERGGAGAESDPSGASGPDGSSPFGSTGPRPVGGVSGASGSSSIGGAAGRDAPSNGGTAGADIGSNGGFEPEVDVPDTDCGADPIPLPETAALLTSAVLAEYPENRPFIRYVSVGAQRTRCSTPATRSVARMRRAVNKLVNSLSIASVPLPARPLEAEPLLLRLDLRDYGWNRPISADGATYRDGWEAIVAHSPLATEFAGADADVLKQQVGAAVPWLLASSFVAAASAGELYYGLTAAPGTLAELKTGLGIGPAEDMPYGSWQRAGFGNSGVSTQDRGVARYAGAALGTGVFWQTFDYLPTDDTSVLFFEPLGTRADGVDVLYSLPNGLPGYFIADAAGRRRVEAPLESDPARGGPPRVMSSCGSCHNGGLIAFNDTVRSFVEANVDGTFTPIDVQAVQDTYPPPDVFNALVEADSHRLRLALAQAGQSENTPDPVSRVALDYDRRIDRDVVASELYLRPDTFDVGSLPPVLATAVTNDSLSRAMFEANYHEALCALQTGPIVPVGCP